MPLNELSREIRIRRLWECAPDSVDLDFLVYNYAFRKPYKRITDEAFRPMSRKKGLPGGVTKSRTTATNMIRWRRKAAAKIARYIRKQSLRMARMGKQRKGRNKRQADDIEPDDRRPLKRTRRQVEDIETSVEKGEDAESPKMVGKG